MDMDNGQDKRVTDFALIREISFSFFIIFNSLTAVLSVVLWLDEGDFPQNLHIVCLCHNK